MEPLSERCYPSNFFDPFGDEPTHSACDGCGEVFDNGDLIEVGAHFYTRYLCQDCLEKEPREDE
jgi:hypothetical protein